MSLLLLKQARKHWLEYAYSGLNTKLSKPVKQVQVQRKASCLKMRHDLRSSRLYNEFYIVIVFS